MKRIVKLALTSIAVLSTATAQATLFNLVSLRSDGTPPSIYSDSSSQPAITPDGRYAVFAGDSPNLVTPGASGIQVYLRDRVANTTELISVSTTGGGGNDSSSLPSISDDGCRVVFTSYASNLVAGDTNLLQDVFVRNRCTVPQTTSLVSASPGNAPGNFASIDGRISGDGSKVVFISDATNLASATGIGIRCLLLRNLNTATTSAITTPAGACITARVPDISANASRVVFWAANVPGTSIVTNGVWQLYLYDFNATPGTQPTVISTNAAGVPQSQGNEGTGTVSAPALSSDGGYVAFASRGSGLVAVDGGVNYHVYIKELGTGYIVRASVDSAGVLGNGYSSGGGTGYRPGISDYAETVTFLSSASNLAPETGGFYPNVVAHNPRTGRTVGFTADLTLNGQPNISARGDLIIGSSNYALDPAYPNRGVFVFPAMIARLSNISTRMQVLGGNDVLIGGFVISGSAPKRVVVRARGPSLIPFGITNALANPTLQLFSGPNVLATNDDWASGPTAAAVAASGFAPGNPLESALLATLNPGAYTAIVSGVGGTTGVGIVEVFEVDRTEAPLINISTRGQVLTGNDVMIGGFVIVGSDPQTVVVRARGPSLIPFGITNALVNPTLQVFSGSTMLAENDDWGTSPDAATITANGFAPGNPLESAILITLNPGAYTAIVRGVGGGTGVGIVEVFAQ